MCTVSDTLQPNQAVAAYTISVAAGSQLRILTTRDNQGYIDRILVRNPAALYGCA